ncbi:facilitated trehalose transporter Tret1-2 homolog isoform X2 [Helicoverpa armigera]|uniref:facilitated trehalose transporter Tret1-2 homolog isoform X2 n=1 Tax=Helicoverpa armigera TaxID=29058 RepID=UPI000B3A9FBF|nr:facilitated trehalose transporter Tret1-2 homolog isoform X2 [Helicoverpa armigera]XP_047026732.1 facilitated trehalose transporter Tret1-2 homolog isoform X1 [Helicoverpa zea]
MRSSLYRRRGSDPEREPLLAAIPASGFSNGFRDGRPEGNGTMADMGVSQAELVEPRGDSGRKLPQYLAALAATLGALAAGSMLGWSAPVMVKLTNASSTDYDFSVSQTQGDWISSIINLGAAFICFPIGLVMDRIGRKNTMLLLVVPFTLGWLLITFGTSVGMLIAGRFITGVAGGAFCVTAPAYTSEIAQDSIRGTLGSYFQLMITIGILFAYVVGGYTSVFVFNILCTCIPIVFGIIFFFMPESPSFLVMKGKHEEAKDALIRLRGSAYDVDYELNNLKFKAEESQRNQVSYLAAIRKKTALKAILICYALMLFQQLSGINAVIFNASQIFADAGATIPSTISTIIIGVIQVIATFISSLVVDKLGRRILLLLSALVMCVCSTALGVYFFLQQTHGNSADIVQAITWLPLVSLSLFIIAFSLGFGPIPWMMAGELCQIDIKAFVGSTAGTFNWLLSFTVTSTFNSLNAAIGAGQVFWLFASIMLVGFVFIFFVVPETKGKSVDEIQVMLGGRPQQRPEEKK